MSEPWVEEYIRSSLADGPKTSADIIAEREAEIGHRCPRTSFTYRLNRMYAEGKLVRVPACRIRVHYLYSLAEGYR